MVLGDLDTDWNNESQSELLLLSAQPPDPSGEKAWVGANTGWSLSEQGEGGPWPRAHAGNGICCYCIYFYGITGDLSFTKTGPHPTLSTREQGLCRCDEVKDLKTRPYWIRGVLMQWPASL